MKPLTKLAVDAIKVPGRHRISANLYLQVQARSDVGVTRSWVFRYTFKGDSCEMGLGGYPLVGLAEARALALKYRRWLEEGKDPKKQSDSEAQQTAALSEHTLKAAAEAFIASRHGHKRLSIAGSLR